MATTATPHDRFFRETFSRKEVARDFLCQYLPAELLAQVDMDSLKIGKDSYIAKDLRQAYSDLVYTVRLKGGLLRIYLLFEHKSWAEYWALVIVSSAAEAGV